MKHLKTYKVFEEAPPFDSKGAGEVIGRVYGWTDEEIEKLHAIGVDEITPFKSTKKAEYQAAVFKEDGYELVIRKIIKLNLPSNVIYSVIPCFQAHKFQNMQKEISFRQKRLDSGRFLWDDVSDNMFLADVPGIRVGPDIFTKYHRFGSYGGPPHGVDRARGYVVSLDQAIILMKEMVEMINKLGFENFLIHVIDRWFNEKDWYSSSSET